MSRATSREPARSRTRPRAPARTRRRSRPPGASPSHAYATAGVYTATLTVTDDGGLTASDGVVVNVANRPPTANAGPDRSAMAGAAVGFNGTGTDLDGTIASYSWTFGDAGTG